MHKKNIIIIGGGLGGMSAAISLATLPNVSITLIEKNNHLGGKLNQTKKQGFTFDLGPSIFTMPHLFEPLFKMHNKNMEDYFKLVPVRPHWRNFFPDGKVLNLEASIDLMQETNDFLNETDIKELKSFYDYTETLYNFSKATLFEHQSEKKLDTLKYYKPWKIIKDSDMFKTMDQGTRKHLSNPYLIDTMNFFIKYVGASPFEAPAVMNLLSYIQWKFDLWYVEGGMFQLSKGLEKLIKELDITVIKNAEVKSLSTTHNAIHTLRLKNGKTLHSDIVISNMEAIPFYEKIAHIPETQLKSLKDKYPASCSGFALHLGLNKSYPQLAHHNIFHGENQAEHFNAIFNDKELPSDPTIYLVAPMKTDPSQGPKDHEIIKILPHIPNLDRDKPFTQNEYHSFKKILLDKLERMGLKDIRKHIVTEEIWTPETIMNTYSSTHGSIYGTLAHKEKNMGFKFPKRSTFFNNLYFVGGSTNPGGGMPMVVLSGQQALAQIKRKYFN